MPGEDTLLDIMTRVHIGPIQEGMAAASSAVSTNVATINAQFRSMQANATAAGESLPIFAARLEAQRAAALSSAAALSEAGLGAAKFDKNLQDVISRLDYSENTLQNFRQAVTGVRTQVTQDMEKMAGAGEASGARLAGVFRLTQNGIQVGARAMSSSLGIMAAAVALSLGYELTKSLVDSERALQNFATVTGIPIKSVQELIDSFREFGASDKEVIDGLQKLGEMAQEAAKGSKTASDYFKTFGINVKDWNGIVPDTVNLLARMADGAAANAGSAELATAAQGLLGAAYLKLMPLLEQGGQHLENTAKSHRRDADAAQDNAQKVVELGKKWDSIMDVFHRAELLTLNLGGSVVSLIDKMHGFDNIKVGFKDAESVVTLIQNLQKADFTVKGLLSAWDDAFGGMDSDVNKVIDSMKKANIFAAQKIAAPVDTKEAEKALTQFQEKMNQWEANIEYNVNKAGASQRQALEIARGIYEDEAKSKLNSSVLQNAAAGKAREVSKQISEQEYQDAVSKFEALKAAGEAQGTWTVQNEIRYWSQVLATQKFATAQQIDIQKQLNTAVKELHDQQLQETVRVDDEYLATLTKGTTEYINAEKKRRDDAVSQEGVTETQKIEFNTQFVNAVMANEKTITENAVTQAHTQEETYAASDARRLDSATNLVNLLKQQQQNLQQGLSVTGQQIDFGTLSSDAKKNADLIAQIQTAMLAEVTKQIEKAAADRDRIEREVTTNLQREIEQRERMSVEEADRLAEIDIQAKQKSSEEEIKQIEKADQYNLVSFTQRTSMIQSVIDKYFQEEQAILQGVRAQAEMNAAVAVGTEAQQRAQEQIARIDDQIARLKEQHAQQEINLTDQVYDHEMQKAQQAASVISSAMNSAFDRMLRGHTNFKTVMEQFWVDMVLGFARMELQIVANAVQAIATRTIAEATGMQQVSSIHAAGAAQAAAADEAASMRSIISSAKSAAAKAWDAMANIPVVGPELGAAAAAATFAGVMALGALGVTGGGSANAPASAATIAAIPVAAKGAYVSRDSMFMLHAGEIVVPAEESKMLMQSGSILRPDERLGGPTSIINQTGVQTTETHLPESISTNISNMFANSTAKTQTGSTSSTIANAFHKMISGTTHTIATAAKGMTSAPHDMLMKVHEKEMVLDPATSTGLRGMIAQGAAGSNSTGPSEVHHHYSPHVNVNVSGSSRGEISKQIEEEVPAAVRRGLQLGRINPLAGH